MKLPHRTTPHINNSVLYRRQTRKISPLFGLVYPRSLSFYKVMKAHSCRNSRDGERDASPLCSCCVATAGECLKASVWIWVGSSTRAGSEHAALLRGAARFSLALMSPDTKAGEEILKYDNRQGWGVFQTENTRRGGWRLRCRWDFQTLNTITFRVCYSSNQHRIFPFQKRSEIVVLDDDGLRMICAFFFLQMT